MQASMVNAFGPCAGVTVPRVVSKSGAGRSRVSSFATPTSVLRVPAHARVVHAKAVTSSVIGSNFARNAGLNAVVARQTVLKSQTGRTSVKCDATAERCVTRKETLSFPRTTIADACFVATALSSRAWTGSIPHVPRPVTT